MKIFLISNMYPSKDQPTYGIFVKVFKENLQKYALIKPMAVIKGRGVNIFNKLFKYIKFYCEIIIKGFWGDYNIIYTHYGTHSALPLLLVGYFISKPLVVNIHGFDIISTNKEFGESKMIHKFLFPYLNKISKNAALVVVPSLYYGKLVLNELNVEQDKIFISPSGGIDLNIFKPLNKLKYREKYNISKDNLLLGFVSTLVESKGWRCLLNALNILKNEGLKFHLITVIHGLQEAEFKSTVTNMGLEGNISYLPKMQRQELVEIYNLFDVFIFPTLSESLGLVALEALACRIPVICSDIEPLNNYIDDKINGLLFTSNDSNDLADKILYYNNLSDDEKNSYSQQALKKAQNFDSEKITEELAFKLNSIIDSALKEN